MRRRWRKRGTSCHQCETTWWVENLEREVPPQSRQTYSLLGIRQGAVREEEMKKGAEVQEEYRQVVLCQDQNPPASNRLSGSLHPQRSALNPHLVQALQDPQSRLGLSKPHRLERNIQQ